MERTKRIIKEENTMKCKAKTRYNEPCRYDSQLKGYCIMHYKKFKKEKTQ